MALITRFSALLRADAHAVLDQIEDPVAVLRQAVRDMQVESEASEQRVRAVQQQLSILEERYCEGLQAVERLNGQLDDALDAGRDDLARGVIRHRLQQEMLNESVDRQISRQRESLSAAREQHREQSSQLENMQQKLRIFGRNDGPCRASVPIADPAPVVVTEDRVELELVRLKKERGQS
ncbi:MAG: PspA/IM30 family protein [Burkholderiaceae bacterium]